ncbi:uncharacterized protein LY89DRAFT_727827 [Mollisia scopiformis]|uniref:Uncharacterized protein n=1 Tax=Mollisia scopiformis TaxID=149040 RepID=A0A194XS70_MOLSC|nr:uncharacterized protein LY89DRAFT_727827 [Mollisia scopiformis]KUJ23043.1 hypothetical protein LY89DRAFT_727827 [Mollisia scopiformis]
MPAPAQVPVLSFEPRSGQPISNVSVGLDATILRSWRDGSEYGLADPNFPYFAMEIQISGWRSLQNIILARYTGGKLKKDALYQLKGRFFVDTTSREAGKSYFHVDEAIRFQGPGTIRSFKKPQFMMVGEVVQVQDTSLLLKWVTRDPYRRDMVYDQMAVMNLEKPLTEKEREKVRDQLCCLEGKMESVDHRSDWICTGIRLC